MNQRSIIAITLISAVLGMAVVGYFKAVPAVENLTNTRSRIEVTPKSFDFGEIEYGLVAKHTFKIKNLGKETLEIRNVATSCACTTAKALQEKINPGEETELLVRYDTSAMGNSSHGKGAQERIIYIKSNDPASPQVEVTIQAYVK